ncbi:deoxyribose-phosphate aldolase [Hymenopellis radicata]|nr:deoxyribose-phosphate aldolase [Hymenopellis radicata]
MERTNEEWTALIEPKIVQSILNETSAQVVSVPTTDQTLASYIDHTLLKPDATRADIDKLCDEALKYKFKSCCVNGANIPQVSRRLTGSSVIPCAVIGFPLGASKTEVKAFETKQAISDGALEIDMVLNIGALRAKNYALTVFLTDEEIVAAAFIAAEAGAQFVKTCTGFLGGGASARHVALMKRAGGVKVKASAGIRSLDKCREMVDAGADRIGTSSGVAIMEGVNAAAGAY